VGHFSEGVMRDRENPASVVRTARDERLWQMAKESAAQQGRARDWPYVMGIFQHMKHRTGSEPVENPREDVVGVEIGGRMVVCDVVDVFNGPPRSFPGYTDSLVLAKAPNGFYVVGFSREDGSLYAPVFRPTMAAALHYIEEIPWEEGRSERHNPDDDDDEAEDDLFSLRAAPVQQGLFAPSSYEAKPEKRKKPAKADRRQPDMFAAPGGKREPVENPSVKLSPAAHDALSVYVLDPAHLEYAGEDDDGSVATSREIAEALDGRVLTLPSEPEQLWQWHARLSYASESALESGDHAWARALNALASKVIDPLR